MVMSYTDITTFLFYVYSVILVVIFWGTALVIRMGRSMKKKMKEGKEHPKDRLLRFGP